MAKKRSPFTRVNEIYKEGSGWEDDEGYVHFIINRELSKNPLLIGLVNEVQKYSDIPSEAHFKIFNTFAPLTRRPGFKEFPWIWKGRKKVSEDVGIVAKHYKESEDNASVMLQVLKKTEEGKEHLKWLRTVYGKDHQKRST